MGRGNVQLPTFHSFTITYPYNIYLFYSSIPCTRTRIHSDGTHLTVGRREIYREMQCKCNNCFGASLNSNWECGLNIYPSISIYVCVVFFFSTLPFTSELPSERNWLFKNEADYTRCSSNFMFIFFLFLPLVREEIVWRCVTMEWGMQNRIAAHRSI